MIRKAIIVGLTLGSVVSAVGWAASYYGIIVEYISEPQGRHPIEIRDVSGGLFRGIIYVEILDLRLSHSHPDSAEKGLALFPPGWRLTLRSGVERGESHWRPDIIRPAPGLVRASTPLWFPMFLLASYPATTFIRGPLRRWRRMLRSCRP